MRYYNPLDMTLPCRPFIKWAGGKRSVLPELLQRIPKYFCGYHEPFLGGGALFFSLHPKEAYLSDINYNLITTFQEARDHVGSLIKKLKVHEQKHNKEYYLKARVRLSKEKKPVTIASLFIYLNKTCFNGLYRVNKSGDFNVPMGDYKTPLIVDAENLKNVSEALKYASIEQHSFLQAKVIKDDFYYLDPPYHETYSSYDGSGFDEEDHKKLADYCKNIDEKNGYFMLSNSDTRLVRRLYKRYNIEIIKASRSVSCKTKGRGKVNELIIRNYK